MIIYDTCDVYICIHMYTFLLLLGKDSDFCHYFSKRIETTNLEKILDGPFSFERDPSSE